MLSRVLPDRASVHIEFLSVSGRSSRIRVLAMRDELYVAQPVSFCAVEVVESRFIAPTTRISPRERECLTWLGKSRPYI